MSGPLDGVPATVELALGANPNLSAAYWTFTQVPDGITFAAGGVQTTQGRNDGFSSAPPSTCHLSVDNRDGRWAERNPMSPWYGLLRNGTPIRVLAGQPVRLVDDQFNGTSTALWPAADVTGDAWVAFGNGGTLADTDYTESAGTAKMSVPAASAYRGCRVALADTCIDQDVRTTVSFPNPTGGGVEVDILLRGTKEYTTGQHYQCQVQVTTGLAVQVGLVRNNVGAGTTLVAPATVAGMTHATATPLNIRARCDGPVVRVKVWQGSSEPAAWNLTYTDATPVVKAGWAGLRSLCAVGNSNTKPYVFTYQYFTLDRPSARFEGFIDELPVSWGTGDPHSRVALTASGVSRRLTQGNRTLDSAAVRFVMSPDKAAPIQYWPMEDAAGSSLIRSYYAGKPSMVYSDMTLGQYSSAQAPGTKALPVLGANGTYSGKVPAYISTVTPTQWRVSFAASIPAATPGDAVLASIQTTGTLVWQVIVNGTTIYLRGITAIATEVLAYPGASIAAAMAGRPMAITVTATQNGANIDWAFVVRDVVGGGAYSNFSNTVAGQTTGNVVGVVGGTVTNTSGITVGHIAVWDDTTLSNPELFFTNALRGWSGDTAAGRINGMCSDARIACTVTPTVSSDLTATLGPQPSGSLTSIVQNAQDAELGILSERQFGYYYIGRDYRYSNTRRMLTLSYDLGQIADLVPTGDDQQRRNDVSVTRTGGGYVARATDDTHIEKYGRYDGSTVSINTRDDSDIDYQAQARVAIGTVDDLRYPQVTINFAATPALLTQWQRMWVGDRLLLATVPRELGYDPVELEIQGWTETIDPRGGIWRVTANCTSAKPWNAWTVEQSADNFGTLDGTGITLASGYSAAATSMQFAIATGNALMATGAQSVDLNLAGERVRLTNVTGTSSPQTATVTRSVNGVVKAQTAQTPVMLYNPKGLAF